LNASAMSRNSPTSAIGFADQREVHLVSTTFGASTIRANVRLGGGFLEDEIRDDAARPQPGAREHDVLARCSDCTRVSGFEHLR
jgi:hypothetical protein